MTARARHLAERMAVLAQQNEAIRSALTATFEVAGTDLPDCTRRGPGGGWPEMPPAPPGRLMFARRLFDRVRGEIAYRAVRLRDRVLPMRQRVADAELGLAVQAARMDEVFVMVRAISDELGVSPKQAAQPVRPQRRLQAVRDDGEAGVMTASMREQLAAARAELAAARGLLAVIHEIAQVPYPVRGRNGYEAGAFDAREDYKRTVLSQISLASRDAVWADAETLAFDARWAAEQCQPDYAFIGPDYPVTPEAALRPGRGADREDGQ